MEQAAMLASKLPAADPSSTFLSRGDVMHHAVGIRPHDLVIVQWRLHETTKPPGPWIVWWGVCKFGLVRDSKDEDDRTAWIQFQGDGAPVKEVAFPQDGDNGTVVVDYLKVIVLPLESKVLVWRWLA